MQWEAMETSHSSVPESFQKFKWILVVTFLGVGMLNLAFNVQSAKASGTIYIKADGSIYPLTAPIQRDGDIYTLTDNFTSGGDGIVIERNNMTLDGAGHTLRSQYVSALRGIDLTLRSNVTIQRFNIQDYGVGVYLSNSSSNLIIRNNITGVRSGIYVGDSSNWNNIAGNIVSQATYGLSFYRSSKNIVRNNTMIDNTSNFYVYGRSIAEFTNDVDTSNTVEGRPIYYWISHIDDAVPSDAGYVALVNCTNISVQNLTLVKSAPGILLAFTRESTITRNMLMNNTRAIDIRYSSNNTVIGNNITASGVTSIFLEYSSNNTITKNSITKCKYGSGIDFYTTSSCNRIIENTIVNNKYGIVLTDLSSNNTIFHNNFVNNTSQVYTYSSMNVWDDGYPSGGNCWSDYNGTDLHSGSYQNETCSDGIGDTEYAIDGYNTDHYPLMGMFSEYDWISPAAPEQRIQTVCNSTISNLIYNGTAISFDVTGDNGTSGFCRIRIPKVFMNNTFAAFVNGTEVSYNLLRCSNDTYSCLYFNYTHSTKEVIIIPEFSSFLILPLFMISTLLAVIVYRKKHSVKAISV
jgi:parallel beta-helix repeat protein